MTAKIEVIKKLRGEGASIKIIDDVASYIGSYESPVLVATVEFIIKIKQMIASVTVQAEQSVGVETAARAAEGAENVNFTAAKGAVNNDDEMDDDERFKMLEVISAVELQHLESKEIEEPELTPKDEQKKKLKATKRTEKTVKNSLLDRLGKMREGMRNRQRQQQNQLHGDEDSQHAAQKANTAMKAQTATVHKAESHSGMRLLKLDFLKSLKLKKDPTMVGDQIYKNYKESRVFAPKTMANAKAENHQTEKAIQEISISKVIDSAVKAPKVETEEKQTVKAEKGKFEAKVETTSGPKADAEKVAQQTALEAIKNLQQSGVKSSGADAGAKKVEAPIKDASMKNGEPQLAQVQTQQATQQQHKQR